MSEMNHTYREECIMQSWPLELQVLTALLRADRDPEAMAFCRANMAELDWRVFLEYVHHHRVYPMICKRLKEAEEVKAPPDVLDSLHKSYRRNAFRMLALSSELNRVSSAFEEEGIRLLVLKGPLFAQTLYGDIGMRTSKDLDLLVPLTDLGRAEALLMRLGYQADPGLPRVFNDWKWRAHHISYRHPEMGIHIELHWRMHSKFHREPAFDQLWERRTSSAFGGCLIHQLAETDLILYLIVHGARHGWFRLRWLLDLYDMMGAMDDARREQLLLAAKHWQVETMFGQCLYLLAGIFKMPLSEPLQAAATEKRAVKHARDALRYLREIVQMHPVPADPELAEHYRRYLLSFFTFRKRIAYYLAALYPNSWDTVDFPLPRRLYFLYVPLRPFLLAWRTLRRGRALSKGVDI